jgi:conserved oligomeric Golgi complex subunit 5
VIIVSHSLSTSLLIRYDTPVALLDGPTPPDAPDSTAAAAPLHTDIDPTTAIDNDDEDPNTPTNTTTTTGPTYIPLRSISVVAAHIPFIEDTREKVTGEMQAMVLTGLTTLVRPFHLSFPLHSCRL